MERSVRQLLQELRQRQRDPSFEAGGDAAAAMRSDYASGASKRAAETTGIT
jgi:hypothetical protein